MIFEGKCSSGGFFHFFDWNRKSKKKLPSNTVHSHVVGSKCGKRNGDLLTDHLYTIGANNNVGGVTNVNHRSDFSYYSPLINCEENGYRPPGVVARLMGLDSLPSYDINEPHSIPSLKFAISQGEKAETFHRKSAEFDPINPNKILTSIQTSVSISSKNRNHTIMKSFKSFDPEFRDSIQGKIRSKKKPLTRDKVRGFRDNTVSNQRSYGFQGKGIVSNVRYKDHYLHERINDSRNYIDINKKGKIASQVVDGKNNRPKREDFMAEYKHLYRNKEPINNTNQIFKAQLYNQKIKQEKCSSNSSNALRKNNQKRNCSPNYEKFPSKPSFEQGEISTSVVIKGKGGLRKGQEITFNAGREELSSHEFNSTQRISFVNGFTSPMEKFDALSMNGRGESMQLNEAMERKSMDIVSFTFTSPMVKKNYAQCCCDEIIVPKNSSNDHSLDCDERFSVDVVKSKNTPTPFLSIVGGNDLSIPWDENQKEKVFLIDSGSTMIESNKNSSLISNDPASQFDISFAESQRHEVCSLPVFCEDDINDEPGLSSTICQEKTFDNEPEVASTMKNSGCNDIQKDSDFQENIPISCSETFSCSNKNCISSDSQEYRSGGNSGNDDLIATQCKEAEIDFSKLLSTFVPSKTQEREYLEPTIKLEKQELECVKKILNIANVVFKDLKLGISSGIIQPKLFDSLENSEMDLNKENDAKKSSIWIKELFDCVNESMSLRCSRYNQAGYKRWTRGVAIVNQKGLAEKVYEDICIWRSMRNLMVNELLERDMNSQLGCWVDFDAEAFKIGEKFGREILCSLIEEFVADILQCPS